MKSESHPTSQLFLVNVLKELRNCNRKSFFLVRRKNRRERNQHLKGYLSKQLYTSAHQTKFINVEN